MQRLFTTEYLNTCKASSEQTNAIFWVEGFNFCNVNVIEFSQETFYINDLNFNHNKLVLTFLLLSK